jgi:hypothetical protein
VFLTIGQGILEGKTPYVDFFDHKGPLLYFINALGLFLGGERGVWFLEFLLLFVSACFAYKTARLWLARFPAFYITGSLFSMLGVYFDSGNIPEEYAMPLMFISLYIYTRFFLKPDSGTVEGNLRRGEIFILGVCFGASLLLKVNLFAVWAVFTAVIFFREALRKNFAFIIRYTAWFFVGTAAVLAPFIIYLFAKEAFSEFLYQNFAFNFKYAAQVRGAGLYWNNLVLVLTNKANAGVCIFLALVVLVLQRSKSPRIAFHTAVLLSILASLLMMLRTPWLGERNQMVLLPLFLSVLAPALSGFLRHFAEMGGKELFGKASKIIKVLICISIFLMPLAIDLKTARDIMRPAREVTHGFARHKMERVCAAVKGKVHAGETVTALGNNCGMYFYTGLTSSLASKYAYQLPVGEIDTRIAREYEADILARKPKLIFVAWPYVDKQPEKEADMAAVRKLFPGIAALLEAEYAKLHVEKGLVVVFEKRYPTEKRMKSKLPERAK